MAYLADSSIAPAVLATVADHERTAAMDAVRAALTDHTHDGVHLSSAIWIITATRRPDHETRQRQTGPATRLPTATPGASADMPDSAAVCRTTQSR